MAGKGNGKGILFMRAHIGFDGPDCLIWPFNRGAHGYGSFGYNGETYYSHRRMCEAANGPAPSPEHQAAHNCGNGGGGCVHPKHLEWKTPLENSRDKIVHGTCYSGKGRPRTKLTREQVEEIRKIDSSAGQNEAANRYGVSSSMIRKIIYGTAWTERKRPFRDFSPDEIRRIRSLKGATRAADLAGEYQVSDNVIRNIWSRRNWAHVA